MTVFLFLCAILGLPELNPPGMLSFMMGIPVALGWLAHIMIGIIFAAFYFYLLKKFLGKVKNIILQGIIFGIIVFIMAQIAMMTISAIADMPEPEDSVILIMIISILGHVIYGIGVILPSKTTA